MRRAKRVFPRSPQPLCRPTARGLHGKRAKRPGERSERLWTHVENARWPAKDITRARGGCSLVVIDLPLNPVRGRRREARSLWFLLQSFERPENELRGLEAESLRDFDYH